ncbi:DUF533 domain-containing protein [Kineobactrum sediminis]|uniref:DUF533 domain-containing protein n=1 Tax=Kineobactrum sediminis TaxID=1905677 RepID=A0A2N5XYZ4_9GAMM|nr:tellurite resistance TerB family protein [Kineobactrum sediminis]PLW81360.1 DUF533 domain-containing protein [Kineobactrum sediminis]
MNFDKIVSNLASSGVLGGLAGGAVGGALVNSKKARKTAGTLLKVGGVAALGTLAWKAYRGYQDGNASPASATTPSTNDPVWQGIKKQQFAISTDDSQQGSTALLLVQAMIAAACADGHMDGDERQRIMARVGEMGLAADEKALVFDALQAPLSLAELCERVDSPELAAEVYLSSMMAVDRGRTEAEFYLDALAFRLGLPEGLVIRLQQEVAKVEHKALA